jgi:hypothetical protein
MKNRFDLEQDLLDVSAICKDLDLFLEAYSDLPTKMTEDQVFNYVFGIRNVLHLRFEKAWDTYCRVFEIDGYADKERSVLDSAYPDGDGYWSEK